MRRAVLLVVLVLAGCSGDDASTAMTTSTAVTTTTARTVGGLTAEQRRRADQLVSVFENSTTEVQYAYAEDLGDGRGITSGRAGFTTATCDALEVIQGYTADEPDDALARFVPELERLCDEGSDDTSGLPAEDYIAAWESAAEDPVFRAAQDHVVDEEYFLPAMAIADDLDLSTADRPGRAVRHRHPARDRRGPRRPARDHRAHDGRRRVTR